MPVPVSMAVSQLLSTQEVPANCIHSETLCTAQYAGTDLGIGSLYVAETVISWVRDDTMGFTLNYKQLIAHAISRDVSSYPRPCVFMLYEIDSQQTAPSPPTGEEEDNEDEDSGNVEIRIAPHIETSVSKIYESISDGQLLHPDDNNSEEEEEGGADYLGGGGLGMSSQIKFDSDGQLMVNQQDDDLEEEDHMDDDYSQRFEDMEED